MSERAILIPEQTIQVPEELGELFNVVGEILDPGTPIWKTTAYDIAEKYPITHGPVIDTDFIDSVSIPNQHWSTYGRRTLAVRHAILESNPTTVGYGRIAFAESHVLEPARSLINHHIDRDVWQFCVETRSTVDEGTNVLSSFALNSLGEFASRLMEWREHRTLSDKAFDIRSDRVAETARHAGRILTPLFAA